MTKKEKRIQKKLEREMRREQKRKARAIDRIVTEDGIVYAIQKPMYKQIWFWIIIVLSVLLIISLTTRGSSHDKAVPSPDERVENLSGCEEPSSGSKMDSTEPDGKREASKTEGSEKTEDNSDGDSEEGPLMELAQVKYGRFRDSGGSQSTMSSPLTGETPHRKEILQRSS